MKRKNGATTKTRSRPNTSWVRTGDITFEDFCAIVPDGVKADLIDGVIYMASPDSLEANDLNAWLVILLYAFVRRKGLGNVYVSRVAYRIGPRRGPEPDISFLSKAQAASRRRGYVAGPPTLAVEIVSPDSVHRDYVLKRAIYEQAGVQEYWIIDPDAHKVTFLVLHKGRFKKVIPVRHIYRSKVLPGFWLDVRWLLSTDRPEPDEVLRGLLEGK